jgi:hypothetical protein
MIKATATVNGRETLLLGLSFGNLQRFLREPGETYIPIKGDELGLPFDVLIFSGADEAAMTEMLKEGIGVNTKVHISDKLKS